MFDTTIPDNESMNNKFMHTDLFRGSDLVDFTDPKSQLSSQNGDDPSIIEDPTVTSLQPHTLLLRDGETIATLYPIVAHPYLLPKGLLSFLLDEFNMEIEKGESFPYYETISMEEFEDIWFSKNGHICVMVLGEIPELDYSEDNDLTDLENNYGTDIETTRNTTQYKKRKEHRNLNLNIQWEKQCLGIFSLHAAYPGRSSHVATGTFLVNAGIRGKGIGKTLVETFVEWAQKIGFTSCCFPLVYGTNVGIRRILETLNFKKIGRLPESAILKGFDVPVDSFIYGKEFTHITKSMSLLKNAEKSTEIAKYERLKYYLETGKYPSKCDRNEKARLRVTAKTHSVLNGKLMTRGKEVIYDLERQQQIVMEMHMVDHLGINRLTTKIVERYHWKGIKQTVTEVIQHCPKCKLRHKDGTGVIIQPSEPAHQAHMLPQNTINSQFEVDHTAQLSQMAAAVVRNLQGEVNSIPIDTTPPDDFEIEQKNNDMVDGNVNISKDIQTNSYSRENIIDDNQHLYPEYSLNTFDKFVSDNKKRKRTYLDVSTAAFNKSMKTNNHLEHTKINNHNDSNLQSLNVDEEQLMNKAILELNETVMANVRNATKNTGSINNSDMFNNIPSTQSSSTNHLSLLNNNNSQDELHSITPIDIVDDSDESEDSESAQQDYYDSDE